jgi:predicted dehydrogenase
MKYRAAIIGCGKIGSEFADDPRIRGIFSHAGAYDACSGTELVAICDSDSNKVELCRKRWNLKHAYTDYHEMLQTEQPDIVSICTPDHTHAGILMNVLKSHNLKAIIAEKPLATNLKQAESIVHEASLRNVILAVNYTRRFDPAHQKIRNLIQNGKIGPIQTINAFYSKGTLHNGTHIFDLARFLGGEIIAVRGFQNLHDDTIDPTISVFSVFQSGAIGFFHACDETSFTIFEMDIIGTKGRIQILESGHVIEMFKVTEDPFYSGYQGLSKYSKIEGMANILLHVVENVADCIAKDRDPLCSGKDAVIALRIAFAARNSIRNNSRLIKISHESE